MANRMTNNHLNSDADRRKSFKAAPADISFIPDPLTRKGSQITHNLSVDDVIVSLANAYENRRARQSTEWEKVGRQNIPLVF